MHLAIVRSDLTYIHHAHGEVVANSSSCCGSSNHTDTDNTTGSTSHGAAHGMAHDAGSAMHMETDGMSHAGHDHGRKMLQGSGSMMHQATHTTAAVGMPSAHDTMMPSGMTGGSGPHGAGHSSVGDVFGPALKTEVTFPSAGTYLLVGQMARGHELILVPVLVSCTG